MPRAPRITTMRTVPALDALLGSLVRKAEVATNRLDGQESLLKTMSLRADTEMRKQNDLFGRVEALEKASKQSPSDRCLFARVRALEERLVGSPAPPVEVPTEIRPVELSSRERFLETENNWLRDQLLRLRMSR